MTLVYGQGVWAYPVLPVAEYIVWDGCGFIDPGYFSATLKQNGKGSVHPGTDFNKRTGGNSDLGAAINAMCSGRVIHVKKHAVWGWVVVIDHPGDKVQTQYAHFQDVYVKVGQPVRVGDQIGTMGRGGQNSKGQYYFYAHLHCEIRKTALPADEWPSNTMGRADAEAYIARTRHDPVLFLASKGAARSAAELKAMLTAQAAPVTPPAPAPAPSVPSGPSLPTQGQPEPNWLQVGDYSTQQPIKGDWVSIWKNSAGELVVWRVEPYKLVQRGIEA